MLTKTPDYYDFQIYFFKIILYLVTHECATRVLDKKKH